MSLPMPKSLETVTYKSGEPNTEAGATNYKLSIRQTDHLLKIRSLLGLGHEMICLRICLMSHQRAGKLSQTPGVTSKGFGSLFEDASRANEGTMGSWVVIFYFYTSSIHHPVTLSPTPIGKSAIFLFIFLNYHHGIELTSCPPQLYN